MKFALAGILILLTVGSFLFLRKLRQEEMLEEGHARQEETEVTVTNSTQTSVSLKAAGKSLADAREIAVSNPADFWLAPGDYFVAAQERTRTAYYPISILGYNSGPDDGKFRITIRPLPVESPGELFCFIPSGYFLIGDRLNPTEPHYVWLQAFWIGAFEVTNAEYRAFVNDPHGYKEDANWTEKGKAWKRENESHASALYQPADANYPRFGKDDDPVLDLKWYEANAYAKWLTKKRGDRKWIFSLPSEAEWEKAARGPDGFDYGLSKSISDAEIGIYNWKKNPDAPVTVVGISDSKKYKPNRYGIYHMSGNVSEWTQSEFLPYNRNHPYDEYERNRDDSADQRVVRGGSWYSASVALLYLPYRDAFIAEHSSMERGFRIVARRLPD